MMEALKDLKKVRRHIHRHPELSGMEAETAKFIQDKLHEYKADEIITGIGGHGLAAVYHSGKQGPRILLRAELDALPITETGDVEHQSEKAGIGHLCGHDGHMTILLGVAALLAQSPPGLGEVVLLFQPAEETGQGAYQVINDPCFAKITPDVAFALHNLPEFEQNTIILREGPFACASRGVILNLRGKTSHAAHPEQGNSPSSAVARIINYVDSMASQYAYDSFVLATLIHARIGEVAFGTTPGEATVMVTLRAALEEDMSLMVDHLTHHVSVLAKERGLHYDISFTEIFPSTVNDPDFTLMIKDLATEQGLKTKMVDEPFRWSEDFGHFSSRCPSVLFGIGSGLTHPSLHNPDYDFNDALLEPASLLMKSISEAATKKLSE